MVCPFCGCRVRFRSEYYRILESHEVKIYCQYCEHVVTITREDAERERELKTHTKAERIRIEGLCNRCKCRKPAPGKKLCPRCIEKEKERERKPNELTASIEGKKYGITAREWMYRRYYGLCVKCGKPSEKSAVLCRKCRKERKEEVKQDENGI